MQQSILIQALIPSLGSTTPTVAGARTFSSSGSFFQMLNSLVPSVSGESSMPEALNWGAVKPGSMVVPLLIAPPIKISPI